MKEAQNLEGHRSFVVVAFILNKKTTLTQCPVSLSRKLLSPGEYAQWKEGSTDHDTRTCTTSIYVHNILRENSDEWIKCTPPPLLILLQMNNQMRCTTESRPFNLWHGPLIFLCSFWILIIKTQTIFSSIIDHIRQNWIIAGTRHQGILKRIVGTRGVRSLSDCLPRS